MLLKNRLETPEPIFRAYDIRGRVPAELNSDVVYNIGKAFGSEAIDQGQSVVYIARDGRLSGPELLTALADGLKSSGVRVISIGAVPTPVLYFAALTKGTGTGIMLTGSHNPADYNGLKMMIAGHTLSGDDIQMLKNRILAAEVIKGKGSYEIIDICEEYINHICQQESLVRPLKIVIDAGNGITGDIAPVLFRKLGCEVIELFCEVDGHFPNHHPDPSKPKNLIDLTEAVKKHEADVGIAFDGDGDRLGLITAKGHNIYPDRQLMLYAKDVLKDNPGATILYDVKCSSHLEPFIEKLGGKAVMYKTGHALIKKELKAIAAKLAGEMSGHTFFNDRWPGFDDGLYTAVRLLEILSKSEGDLDDLFAAIPDSISTPELNIAVADHKKFDVVNALVNDAPAAFPKAKIITIDGVRVEFENGWALVRASNTTPCLVLRFEADDEVALSEIRKGFGDWVEAVVASH
ncbi:MAG: phosphomannomutase/phosphoglucomutase [Francisellaceae bacterium]